MVCWCCGEDKTTVALGSRDDVELCRDCLEWLLGRVGVASTPILPVVDLTEAVVFYERAGFGVRIYRDDSGEGDGFAFVDYDGQSVFDLDAAVDLDPSANWPGCYLVVRDADGWHARMATAGLLVTPIVDELWGMREVTLTDPPATAFALAEVSATRRERRPARRRSASGEVEGSDVGPHVAAELRGVGEVADVLGENGGSSRPEADLEPLCDKGPMPVSI